ncbi:DNA-directed RNA polymerase subunit alpha C-terminal domain-containing protein [Spirillospora sp. NPDC048824]|uniref:DNA-directed RNA polymerase subunit alpha C-terminal domain-containing protein n=1 Tax=Spirillospora sp. NPDC048824 TaxID=3364526 RepID=UPI0037152F3D
MNIYSFEDHKQSALRQARAIVRDYRDTPLQEVIEQAPKHGVSVLPWCWTDYMTSILQEEGVSQINQFGALSARILITWKGSGRKTVVNLIAAYIMAMRGSPVASTVETYNKLDRPALLLAARQMQEKRAINELQDLLAELGAVGSSSKATVNQIAILSKSLPSNQPLAEFLPTAEYVVGQVNEWCVSNRTRTTLKAHGITSVNQLRQLSITDLLSFRDIGRASIAEIIAALALAIS